MRQVVAIHHCHRTCAIRTRVGGGARAMGFRCTSGPTRQSEPILSREAETCRGGPASGELVGDAANWPKTGRLASVGLDQGPYSSLS
jgi:hypothetical protein